MKRMRPSGVVLKKIFNSNWRQDRDWLFNPLIFLGGRGGAGT